MGSFVPCLLALIGKLLGGSKNLLWVKLLDRFKIIQIYHSYSERQSLYKDCLSL